MKKAHQTIAYTLEGDYIKGEQFATAEEAWECQMKWLKENDKIMVMRTKDGKVMTILTAEDIA